MAQTSTTTATYTTLVRQLDSSPSQMRRYYTQARNKSSTTRNGTNRVDSVEANSTIDSGLAELCGGSRSEYSHTQSPYLEKRLQYRTNSASPLHTQQNEANMLISDYDKIHAKKKSSLEYFADPSVTARAVNNNHYNYTSFSEVENSECTSMVSSCKPGERPCDKYGFFLDEDNDDDDDDDDGNKDDEVCEPKTPTPHELKSIRKREKKWLQMLNNWKYYINFKWEKIRDRCRKGIPHSLRSQAWFYLCGGHIQKRRYPRLFNELLNKDIPDDVQSDIYKDLHRQFPMHELFADRNGTGQTDLFNVLKAFAVYKPKIGYCQAQGPIAAVLLMHMPAEHAFWSLVTLNDYYIGGYFIHNLEEIEIHGKMLFAFLKKFSPNAYNLLKRQNIEPVLYMTEWFMCIYSRNLPWTSVLRVWDMFLCEGVTVLFKVGIYLVDTALRHENVKTCPTMYETCQKLRNIPKRFLTEAILMKNLKNIDLKDADLLREHKIQLKKHRKTKNKK